MPISFVLRQALSQLFQDDKLDHAQLVASVVSFLPASSLQAAANSCQVLRAAVQRTAAALRLHTGDDVTAAAAAVALGRFPNVVQLELEAKAVADADASLLLALKAPKLRQLSSLSGSSAVISSLSNIARYSQLCHLKLELAEPAPPAHQLLLRQSLSQLVSLSRLTLVGQQEDQGMLLPLGSMSCMSNLRELSLGGLVQPTDQPPAVTALTLNCSAGRVLPSVSSCLVLEQLHLCSVLLPEHWIDSVESFWVALTPLTRLTRLEGSIRDLGAWWGNVGSEAADSLPVVQRLRRLCLSCIETEPFADGQRVHARFSRAGSLSQLTGLEALWLDYIVDDDDDDENVLQLPLGLRELRIPIDLGRSLESYRNLTALTVEVVNEEYPVNLDKLPPSLQELTLVADVHCLDEEIGTLKMMPELRRFTLFGFKLSVATIAAIICLHPCLEEVHFYRHSDDYIEEAFIGQVREVLQVLHRKPVVKVSKVSYINYFTQGPSYFCAAVIGPTFTA
jgi:hypothetical protein